MVRDHVSPRADYSKKRWSENRERLMPKNRQWKKDNRIKLRQATLKHLTLKTVWYRKQKDKPCADCGHKFPHYAMDFDHVRGEKLFNISKDIGKSKTDLLEEMDKCDLVCSNCHRERTFSGRTSEVDEILRLVEICKGLRKKGQLE